MNRYQAYSMNKFSPAFLTAKVKISEFDSALY